MSSLRFPQRVLLNGNQPAMCARYVYHLNIPASILDHEAMRTIKDQASLLVHLSVPFICILLSRVSSIFNQDQRHIVISQRAGTYLHRYHKLMLNSALIDGQPNRQHSSDSRYREQVFTAAGYRRCMQSRVRGSQDSRRR